MCAFLRYCVVRWLNHILLYGVVNCIVTVDPSVCMSHPSNVCTAAISLAVVIGFASLLPGGAGVRELVVTTVLSVVIGPSHAILAAIAARIMFAVCEAFVALCCWIWLRGSLRIKVQGGDTQ